MRKCTVAWTDMMKGDLHSMCKCKKRLDGKTVIITGANQGIGYIIASSLADQGALIIMACRSETRAKDAMTKMKQENADRKIIIEIVDISLMESVRNCVKRINAKYDKVDILINNAGAVLLPGLTEEGFDNTFATNTLGHFLLTNGILDKLKASDEGRIITLSSLLHVAGTLELNKFRSMRKSGFKAYCDSKLCNILFTTELARRLKGTNVIAVSVHPGAINTSIGLDYFGGDEAMLTRMFGAFKSLTYKTPLQGAQTAIHVALNDDVLKHSGKYFSECEVSVTSTAASSESQALKFWSKCEQLLANLQEQSAV